MTHNAHVPKFGDWDGDHDVPYTAYFDSARNGRKGEKMINPNDPEENPDMFRNIASRTQSPPPEVPILRGVIRPAHERRGSREHGDVRQFIGSPAPNDSTGRRASGDSVHQRNGNGGRGSGSGRPIRQSGSEHNIERSPLHPHYQAKVVGKGSASLGLEGKNSFDSSHGTPGRSRMRPGGRGDETPDRGAAVPKFGEWDEKNPSSADGYTHIFNKVREERHIEAGKSPTMDNERFYAPTQKQKNGDDDMKGCCFPWGRK